MVLSARDFWIDVSLPFEAIRESWHHIIAVKWLSGWSTVAKPKLQGAILLIASAGALRRSEIGAPDIEDVTFAPEGAVVHLRRTKNDQIGSGTRIAIPRASTPKVCPVRALTAGPAASRRGEGG